MKDVFFFSEMTLVCRLVSAILAFVCTARTKMVVHVKDPMFTF